MAYEFDFYTFAEGMGQIFSYPNWILQGLLGGGNVVAKGYVMDMVKELADYWTSNGRRLHVGLAVPNFRPTPIWKGGKTTLSHNGFYARPIEAFLKFLRTGQTEAKTGRYKYQRFFGEMLEYLDEHYNLQILICGDGAITFHIIAFGADYMNQQMTVTDMQSGKLLEVRTNWKAKYVHSNNN